MIASCDTSNENYPIEDRLADVNTKKMCTSLQDLNPAIVREALINWTIDLSCVNPNEIAFLLRMAVLKNDEEYATVILEQVPGILKHDNGGGKMLWHALENGNESLAAKLVRAGADLNYRSRNGSNLLHRFMHKYEKIAILMIESGADINISNSSNKTVLYVAVESDLIEIVDTITKLHVTYKDDNHILALATASKCAVTLLEYLTRSPDVSTKKTRARKVLVYYLQKKSSNEIINENLVKSLIGWALMPSRTDSEVIRILKRIVVYENYVNVVQLLLNYVTSLDGNSEQVASLLCHASRHWRSAMSILLIQKGANVNTRSKDNECPLHAACRSGSLQNIHLLVSLGAELTAADTHGITPFCRLTTKFFNETHKLLIRHFAIMDSKNLSVRDSDKTRIYESQRMRQYYEECLNELWDMKKTRLYEKLTFYCIFEKTLQELADLTRHEDFLRTYYLNQGERSVSFPHYSLQMHNTLRMAIDRKNISMARANAYEDAIMHAPPYARISYAIHNVPDLANFQHTFYLQLHERINDKHEPNYQMNLLY